MVDTAQANLFPMPLCFTYESIHPSRWISLLMRFVIYVNITSIRYRGFFSNRKEVDSGHPFSAGSLVAELTYRFTGTKITALTVT